MTSGLTRTRYGGRYQRSKATKLFDDINPATLYDASINYTGANGHWTASVFGDNLTNEDYRIWGASLGAFGHADFVGNPRTYGMRLTYEY